MNISDKNNLNNLNNELNNIKNYLLDYLYNKLEVNEHKYTIIKNISDIYDLKSRKYYVSANSCGINSFIIFLKKDGNYYSYWIDRRSISYNRQSLKKSSVRITEIKLNVDLKLYDGTILDGILIDNDNTIVSNKNSLSNNKMYFMITDVFTLCGKSLITMDYKKKMYFISIMFEKIIENNSKNNIELYVSRPFELNYLETLFKEYIENNIKNYNIKGISFYPQYSGTKLIYIFDKQDDNFKNKLFSRNFKINNEDIKNDENSIDYLDNKKIFKFELNDPECIDDIILNLEMKKTGIPDVYKLYGVFYNNKKQYIKKKIGNAYIPTYILSLKCKIYFLNKNSLIMSCYFNTNKNKWVPIEEASVKKIDIINNEKRLNIIEQEINDDNDNENEDYC